MVNKPEQVKLSQEEMVKRVHEIADKDDALLKHIQGLINTMKIDHPDYTFEAFKVTIEDDTIEYDKEFKKYDKNTIHFTGYINEDPKLEFEGIVGNPGSDNYLNNEQNAMMGSLENKIGVRNFNFENIPWEGN